MVQPAVDTSPRNPATTTSRADERPDIPIPGEDDFLEPRYRFAKGVGISGKTAGKLNLPTAYIANVAYVRHNASLRILATHRLRNRRGRR
jgi:hypothetical protein